METITTSATETKKLGKEIGSSLAGGEILALVGDLGSGKTTFVQGLAQGLGIKKRIISPTFILMRKYNTSSKPKALYHVDLYRLENNIEFELTNLGIDDVWEDKDSIVVIEWAEKAKKAIPKSAKWIHFETVSEKKRKINLTK